VQEGFNLKVAYPVFLAGGEVVFGHVIVRMMQAITAKSTSIHFWMGHLSYIYIYIYIINYSLLKIWKTVIECKTVAKLGSMQTG
jgi:hypothetical protein